MKLRRASLSLALLAAIAAAPSAEAVRLNYRFDLRAEYADNLARRGGEAQSDTVLAPRLGFALTEDSERLSLRAAGDIERRHYQRGRFDDETLARIGVAGDWRLLPQRLSFAFEDALSEQPVNSLAVDAPGNRQRVNVLVAGPTLQLQPSARSRLAFELRHTDTDAEVSRDFNSQRLGFNSRGLLELDPLSVASLNIELSEVDFDLADGNADYRREDGFLRYDRRSPRGELSVDAGGSRVRLEASPGQPADRLSDPLLRLRGAFNISDVSRIEFGAARQLSDAARDMLSAAPQVEDFSQPIGIPRLQSGAVSADLFQESLATLGLAHRGVSTQVRLDGFWRKQDYLSDGGLDQRGRGFTFAISRQLRPSLALGAFAGSEWRDLDSLQRDDRDRQSGLNLSWRRSRNLGFAAEISRSERDSSDPTQRYEDHRLLLSVSYTR